MAWFRDADSGRGRAGYELDDPINGPSGRRPFGRPIVEKVGTGRTIGRLPNDARGRHRLPDHLAAAERSRLGCQAFQINLHSTAAVPNLAVAPPKFLMAADEGTLSTDDPAAHLPPPHPATRAEMASTRRAIIRESVNRPVCSGRRYALGLTVWLLGSAVLSLQLLIAHRRMVRLRASAVPAEAEARELCVELAEQMGVGSPAVLRSPFLFSPCLDGIRRPAILLPEETRDKLRDTFVHDLRTSRDAMVCGTSCAGW